MVNSALVFTRGPVVAVYSHNGTVVHVYGYEGTPRTHSSLSLPSTPIVELTLKMTPHDRFILAS